MASETNDPGDTMTRLMEAQAEAARAMFGHLMPGIGSAPDPVSLQGDMQRWAETSARLQSLWFDYQTEQTARSGASLPFVDPTQWLGLMEAWTRQVPFADPEKQKRLWEDSLQLWQAVLGTYTPLSNLQGEEAEGRDLPRNDKRFRDERWRAHPAFALIHQTYLMVAERIETMVDELESLPAGKREQLRFATKAMMDALSPSNFPMTNPVVLERTLETRGENLVTGMQNLFEDMKRGQLTHTDPSAFKLGENIAVTPGKVVHETELYQLIQYSPTTDEVLEVPLVIFPPWINRFYILDLNPKKSFVRWAVEQGLTTFVVSWKSADASLAHVEWDDYIRAQIDAIDHINARLGVPGVHAIGYCVSGTTLAATLAILARRGETDKVRSATFFTAQVDFEKAGDLLHFVDDQQLATYDSLATDGYLDGRYMAATFNLLRGTDLIWNYVINNYMLGQDYPAFDLLHWNGDVTNLPAKWHRSYLKDLYRDNKLVEPDAMSGDNTPIDLGRVETPCYVQAGREDHIAPPESVWRITHHFKGSLRFVLAGSGHIAGVVNPPEAQKYQYWINEGNPLTLEEFREGAQEHQGSWWPDWIDWIRRQSEKQVPVKGKRKPGGRGDKAIEDAPGRYVMAR